MKVQVVARMCDDAIIWPVVSVVGCNFSVGTDICSKEDDGHEER